MDRAQHRDVLPDRIHTWRLLRQEPQIQEGRLHRTGLELRVRDRGWIPENAGSQRWQGHSEDLDSFGTTDLAPYVSQLDPGADAFLNCLPGNDTIVCFKLLKEYGLGDGRGVLCPPGSVDETLLDGMGDEAVGAISCGWYSPTSHAPGASELEVGFRQKYKSDPGALSTGSMLAGLVLEQALIKLGGNAADKAALAKALHEVAIADSPFGSVKLDEYGNAVLTMYIRRVVRRNGRLANEAIAEVRDVDQFYKLDPRTQLALPPFGRA